MSDSSSQVKGEEAHLEEQHLKRSLSHDHTVSLPEIPKKLQRCKSEEAHFPTTTTATSNSGTPTPNASSRVNNQICSSSNNQHNQSSSGNHHSSTGHRPVTSCTHCRQHKIKCNASDNFPAPCSRCERMGLDCQIDPQFRPKKGSQLQNLRRDVDELKLKIEYLTRNESLIARALQQSSMGQELINTLKAIDLSKVNELSNCQPPQKLQQRPLRIPSQPQGKVSVQTYLGSSEPQLLQEDTKGENENNRSGNFYRKDIPLVLQMALQRNNSVSEMNSSKDDNTNSNKSRNKFLGSQGANSSFPQATSTHNVSGGQEPGNTTYGQDNRPLFLETGKSNNFDENDINNDDNDNDSDGNGIEDSSNDDTNEKKPPVVATTNAIPLLPSPHAGIDEFVIGDVRISIEKANELHCIFVTRFLPYFPIMYSNSATELYSQSQLLFWTVMLTACLSDPEPSMYIELASLIKQLAIETCWIRTPRSTHITQALLILCIWPLPNQKVLDDCSYRFVGLAKCLSYQLGLHRGEFISEFTRTQTSMPDAEKWRTRTWLGIFFAELCWVSVLGLPPTSQTDYLVEDARMGIDEEDESLSHVKEGASSTNSFDDEESKNRRDNFKTNADNDSGDKGNSIKGKKTKLPRNFRRLICLAHFQAKLCKVMGSSVASPDGLMEPRERAASLAILERELEGLDRTLNFGQDTAVCIYYLYVKLMVCCFAFLPGTPTEDQSQYVTEAYLCATKIVTSLVILLEKQQLIELPIYIRQSATYAALILFKLQLTPLLLNKYLDSARQSIVTVHRLFRNQLSAWATAVENDISRTASVLEKLNFVLITHPTVFVEEDGIISRMRSHLTGSLFYDLVWCVHEARRREMDPQYNEDALKKAAAKRKARGNDSPFAAADRRLYPLPFYNQISKEDFETIIQTTPGGTTVSTLVPTKTALNHAKRLAENQNDSTGTIMEINGIPLSMLDETGSVNLEHILGTGVTQNPVNVPTATTTTTASMESGSSIESSANVGASNFPDTLAQSLHLETPLYSNPNSSKKNTGINESTMQNLPEFINEANMQRSNSTPAQPSMGGATSSMANTPITTATQASTVPPVPSNSIQQGPRATNSLFSIHNSSFPPSLNKSLETIREKDSNNSNILMTNGNDGGNENSSANRVNLENYANLNLFFNANQAASPSTANSSVPVEQNSGGRNPINQLSELDTFFQQQSTGWLEGNSSNDDFLGWFDMNMEPKF